MFGQTRKIKGHADSFADVMNICICQKNDLMIVPASDGLYNAYVLMA